MPKYARPNSYTGKQSSQSWTGQTRAANVVEAAAGTDDQLYISPLTLAESLDTLVPHATASSFGVVQLTDNLAPVATVATKAYADNLAIAGAPAWSETVSGIGQLATTAEAQAATNDNVAMTPLKTAELLATPPAIGGTTPAAGSFTAIIGTTIDASGLISGAASASIDTAGTALDLATDADTAAVNIGTGAAARTLTIGNITAGTAVAVNTGTGGFTVSTTGAGDIILNSDDTVLIDADGVLELNSSAGVIGIGNDADAQNINIGTGAAQRIITIGNSTSATQVVVNGGTSGINIGANSVAQTVTIGNQTGASAVVIDAGTGPINIGTAIAKVITIGNTTGATGVAINVGTGNFALNGAATSTYTFAPSTTSGTINFGGTGANTGTMTIAGGTGAQTINIANSTGVKTVNIGTGAAANVITIGTTNTTAALTLQGGSGNVNVAGANLTIATTGKGLQIKGGAATDFVGNSVLTAGTVTIANTNIATGDLIFIQRISAEASTTLGQLTYTISNGTSFTVTSVILGTPGDTQTGDVSTFAYQIVRPV